MIARRKLPLILISCFISTLSYAGWDPQCLQDCFATGHDCKYCSYQCFSEDTLRLTPNYSGDATCPLQSYYRSLDQ